MINLVKMPRLLLFALSTSALSMGMYAYRNYTNQKVGFGIILSLLCLFFVGLVICGFVRNKKIDNKEAES